METNGSRPRSGLDREAALSRVGGDADLLKEIACVFVDDCPRALAELRDAAARGDFQVVERAAHGLKGAASNFGASNVVAAALHLETMGRSRKLDGFDHGFQELETVLSELRAELETLMAS
jgi:two-component system, sensor histidine kinase and response regulator